MKYLGLHKAVLFLFIVLFTLFEGIMIFIIGIIQFSWTLKWSKDLWSSYHKAEQDVDNHWGGYAYEDQNMWQTIKRRYNDLMNCIE